MGAREYEISLRVFNSPVYKKDEVTIKSNYRPVSVLSTIPKLFERAKFDQLYHAFAPLFSDNMSGFLRGHSCCTALVKLSACGTGQERKHRGSGY